MRKNKQIFLTILITLALVCLAWSAGLGRDNEKTVACVVAREKIAAGSQILASQLETIRLPASAAACCLNDISQAEGRWTSQEILPGELISSGRLAVPAPGIQYPDAGAGRRLMTIKLEPSDANGFWLAAGNRIDLYLVPVNRENGLEIQVMEGIRVLAVLNGGSAGASNGAGAGAMKANAETLLCLDLSAGQVRLIFNAFGLYKMHAAVVNELRTAD